MCNGDGRILNEKSHRHHNHHHQLNHNHNGNNNNSSHKHNHTSHRCSTTNMKNEANVNGNIYENDDEVSECERMINNNGYQGAAEVDRHSECCSSAEDGDNDTCCSCSESSCLYTEAIEPVHQTETKVA